MIDDIGIKVKYLAIRNRMLKRALVNYAAIAAGRKPLKTVHIAPDWTCNANCSHCYSVPFEDAERRIMSLDEWERAIVDCIRQGALNFVFQGGEPLVSQRTEPLIRIVNGQGAYPVVNTNGILLAEKAAGLKKAGLEWVNVSFNVFRESHDRFYGKPGLFEHSIEGVAESLRVGMNVIAVTIATNESLASGETLELARFLNGMKVDTWLVYPMPSGGWAGRKDMCLSPESLKKFDSLLRFGYIHWEGEGNYIKRGCAAGLETIFITAHGDVTPCAGMDLRFGNVLESSVGDILKRIREIDHFNKVHPRCVVSADESFRREFLNDCDSRPACSKFMKGF